MPLYPAPDPGLSATFNALGLTELFHAAMAPSSEQKRKRAGLPGASSKLPVSLKVCPVGAEVRSAAPPAGAGMGTTSGFGLGNELPSLPYTVVVPVWLFEIQNGLVPLA